MLIALRYINEEFVHDKLFSVSIFVYTHSCIGPKRASSV